MIKAAHAVTVVIALMPTVVSAQVVPASTGQPVAPALATSTALPKDLSPMGMFRSADIVVKGVMLGLAFASLITWTVAVAKAWELHAARRAIRRDIDVLSGATSTADAVHAIATADGARPLIQAATDEMQESSDTDNVEGIKERVVSRLQRIEAGTSRVLMKGTGVLATIGATAPFVGLFGTVWGIMNSFIGISKLHTTNLAIVAPGIAEALLATAMGLVAAIPAVVIYNAISRAIGAYRAQFADASAIVLRLASRDLDRHAAAQALMHEQGAAALSRRVLS